jgi:peptidoglycan/xylan/chitin deacetylase (PgdA/CDA1 family)
VLPITLPFILYSNAEHSPSATHKFAVPVLLYHNVGNITKDQDVRNPRLRDLTVTTDNFELQMKTLVDNGFTVLSTDDIENAIKTHKALPIKAIAITFDDGYSGVYQYAFPILKKYRLPATVFLVTGEVGKADHLSWEESRVMNKSNIRFGSHTIHHYNLTTLRIIDLQLELIQSKAEMDRQLQCCTTSIAYPNGAYNQLIAGATSAVGYTTAWRKSGGPIRPQCDLILLPRMRVTNKTTIKEFHGIIYSGVWMIESGHGDGKPTEAEYY